MVPGSPRRGNVHPGALAWGGRQEQTGPAGKVVAHGRYREKRRLNLLWNPQPGPQTPSLFRTHAGRAGDRLRAHDELGQDADRWGATDARTGVCTAASTFKDGSPTPRTSTLNPQPGSLHLSVPVRQLSPQSVGLHLP